MFKAVFTDGLIISGNNLRIVYKKADGGCRLYHRCGYGKIGYTLINSRDEVIMQVKDGKDMTLTEVKPSVRLYHTVIRRLLTEGLIEKRERDVTLGKLRQFVEDGVLRFTRNMGFPTYVELFDLLGDYVGWTDELETALVIYMTDMKSRGIEWLEENIPNWKIYL